MIVSKVPSIEVEIANKSGDDFFDKVPPLDWVMYSGWMYLIWIYTHMLLYGGPAQICKTYLLTENKRIFAFLLFFLTACRALAEGICFDELVPTLSDYKFMTKRLISVSVDIVTVIILYPMVKDELGEIWRTNNNPFKLIMQKLRKVSKRRGP